MRTISPYTEVDYYLIDPYRKGTKLLSSTHSILMFPRDSWDIFLRIDNNRTLLVAGQVLIGILLMIPIINILAQLILFDYIGVKFSRFPEYTVHIRKNVYVKVTMSSKELSDRDVDSLVYAMKNNTSVRYLDLSKNKIGDKGAKKIADLLRTHPSLEWLNLSDNCIGDRGMEYIAEAIKSNFIVKFLFLSNNSFGDQGVLSMTEGLKLNKKIGIIDLQSELTHEKVLSKPLEDVMQDSSSLKTIFFAKEGSDSINRVSKKDKVVQTNQLSRKSFDNFFEKLPNDAKSKTYC